jgi:hypothetical protein
MAVDGQPVGLLLPPLLCMSCCQSMMLLEPLLFLKRNLKTLKNIYGDKTCEEKAAV